MICTRLRRTTSCISDEDAHQCRQLDEAVAQRGSYGHQCSNSQLLDDPLNVEETRVWGD